MPTTEMTPKEAALMLGISHTTLDRYVARGTLRPIRVLPSGYRRFDRAEVLALRDDMLRPSEGNALDVPSV